MRHQAALSRKLYAACPGIYPTSESPTTQTTLGQEFSIHHRYIDARQFKAENETSRVLVCRGTGEVSANFYR
jgi:hypothetical protein